MKVTTESKGAVFIVTINRPEVRNAVDKETALLLSKAFQYFNQSDQFEIAILTGSDGCFCSGADLQAIASEGDRTPELRLDGDAPLGVSRMLLSKPVLAAVEGFAVAGGLELACWCDMRVSAEDAVYGVFCRRFGVPLVDGGTVRLPRMIGHSRAMDMILSGRGVKGQEAVDFGLTNRMVKPGQALEAALQLAEQIIEHPSICMRSDRMSAYEQWSLSSADALMNESRRGAKVIESGETLAGSKKFSKGKGRHGKF